MATTQLPLAFPLGTRKPVAVDWQGGELSSDGGWLLLALVDRQLQLTAQMAACLTDLRDPSRISHPLADLLRQRIYQIAQGYPDANDAQSLRADPLLKLAVGRPPSAASLAGQSTFSRLENAATAADLERLEYLLQDLFVARCGAEPRRIVLDLDPYDDPAHGQQQGVLFNGYYDTHCYLPLLICGTVDDGPQHLIGVVLRDGTASPTAEATGFLADLVTALRERYPSVEIIVRGDSGFGVPVMIEACRELKVHFCFGKGKNPVLLRQAEAGRLRLEAAEDLRQQAGVRRRPGRVFAGLEYQARDWARAERVVVKWELTYGTPNPRFVVTDLSATDGWTPAATYRFYCARGDRENRIKEFKLDMSGDRLSCSTFLANQFRLYLHAAAYVLYQAVQTALRMVAPTHELARAQVNTLRCRLMKVAARVQERQRVIRVHLCTGFPFPQLWEKLARCWWPPPAATAEGVA